MGRVTYEAMAEFWPISEDAYVAPMNDIPKVVFSKTLERADWPESRIARGALEDEIADLKREPGTDLIAWGGAVGAELDDSISKLLAVPGIGPWIASYLAMRVLGDPDAFLYGCQRLERALKRLGLSTEMRTIAVIAQQWRPWITKTRRADQSR